MKDLLAFIDKHFVAVLMLLGGLLILCALLFRELVVHYQRTKKAMLVFVQFILGIRKAAKGDDTADDALAKTITPGEVKAKDVQP